MIVNGAVFKLGYSARVLTYVLFMAYGLYSIFFPIFSVDRVSDHWLEVLLGSEFVFAGAAMLYGLCRNHFAVWKMGMSVAFVGLSIISSVIALAGGLAVLAYAALFGAFACQCLYGITREQERRNDREIRRQLEAIVTSVRPEGTKL